MFESEVRTPKRIKISTRKKKRIKQWQRQKFEWIRMNVVEVQWQRRLTGNLLK